MGKSLHRQERIGFVLAIFGVAAIMMDPHAHRTSKLANSDYEKLKADVVNLASASFGALYFILNSHNVKVLPLCMMFVFQYTHIAVINAVLAKFTAPNDVMIFSLDVERGCFGFLNPQIAAVTLLPYGILCCLMGSAGYIMSLLYFSPELIANCFLLEPFNAQFLGCLFGLDSMPGVLTIIGTAVTLVCIYLIE